MTDELMNLTSAIGLKRVSAILETELSAAVSQGTGYGDFLVRIFREEFQFRQSRSLENRIAKAKIPQKWCLETFPFKSQPAVKPAVIKELAKLAFVVEGQNIVFVGPPGVGKTGLATSLLLKALENGYRGLFIKAQDLFDDMYASLADRSTRKLLNHFAGVDVLLIDELGYLNLRPEQANIFFRLMEDRYPAKSTIITTNMAFEEWGDFLHNKRMAQALVDRLLHKCHIINIDGPSLRART